jgi:hypothetical protein
MKVDLDQILALAGDLAEEGARDRFRRFLLESTKDSDSMRQLADEASKEQDRQHRLAQGDLVWSLGVPLGFEPSLSFEGVWISPSGVHVLLEMVAGGGTPEIASILGRIKSLVSASTSTAAPKAEEVAGGESVTAKDGDVGEMEGGEEEDDEGLSAFGLLIVEDSEILRVEDAILDEDEEGQVRTISISALLALSKIAKDYHLTHEDILLLLLTSGPSVDPLIDLISRVISQCEAETPTLEEIAQILGPLGRGGESTPGEALQDLIDQSQFYAFGSRGSGRREMRL